MPSLEWKRQVLLEYITRKSLRLCHYEWVLTLGDVEYTTAAPGVIRPEGLDWHLGIPVLVEINIYKPNAYVACPCKASWPR